jgi:hypothetical protein
VKPKLEVCLLVGAQVGVVAVFRGSEGRPKAAEEVSSQGDDESGVVQSADRDLELLVGDGRSGE